MIWPTYCCYIHHLASSHFHLKFKSVEMCLLQGEVYSASEIQKYSYFMNLVPVSHFPFPAQAGGAKEEDKEYQCFQFPPHSWHSPLALQCTSQQLQPFSEMTTFQSTEVTRPFLRLTWYQNILLKGTQNSDSVNDIMYLAAWAPTTYRAQKNKVNARDQQSTPVL